MKKSEFVILLSILFLKNIYANDECIRIKGQISFINHNPTAREKEELSEFNISKRIGTNHWFIEVVPQKGPFDYKRGAYDGINLYVVSSKETSLSNIKKKDPTVELGKNIGNGWIFNDREIPHVNHCHELSPLWLTYTSEYYFKNQKSPYIEPALTLGPGMRYYAVTSRYLQYAHWKISTVAPYFLENATYYNDSFTITNLETIATVRISDRTTNNITTNVVFNVNQFTNISSFSIPQISETKIYLADVFNPEKPGKLMYEYKIKLTSVSLSSEKQKYIPELSGIFSISDVRYEKSMGIVSYFATNRWPINKASLPLTKKLNGVVIW